jgi:hypothetical protein
MPQRPFDGGDAAALLCAYYPGITPWNLDDLTDEQRDLYLSRVGLLRYYNDLAALQKMFGALDEEAIEKIIKGDTDPKAERRALAWELFALKPYGLLAEVDSDTQTITPLNSLSPEAAEGIVQWWSPSGGLYDLPEGPMIWREHLMSQHRQLISRAAQMEK